MINVIWVDDLILNPDGSQTDLCKSIVNSAYDEGIDITPFDTYEMAYQELERHPSKWIAIILDVRNDNATIGSENVDYLKTRRAIERFRKEHGNSVEPYIFVFSADPTTVSDAKRYFIKDAEIQTKEVYIKPNDTDALFGDIKKVANLSNVYATYKKFEDIMADMDKMGWSQEDQSLVFNLIKAIDSDNESKNHVLLTGIRKLFESAIFRQLDGTNIMTEYSEFLEKQPNTKDSLNNRSKYIGGNKNVPIYIQRAFHSLVSITQNGSHDTDDKVESNLTVTGDVSKGKAPYLLKSCLYELLSIICWESQL